MVPTVSYKHRLQSLPLSRSPVEIRTKLTNNTLKSSTDFRIIQTLLLRSPHKMKTNKYHTTGTVSKSKQNVLEPEANSIPLTRIYLHTTVLVLSIYRQTPIRNTHSHHHSAVTDIPTQGFRHKNTCHVINVNCSYGVRKNETEEWILSYDFIKRINRLRYSHAVRNCL